MPGHLNERTLRDFQVNQFRFFGEDINGLQRFVAEMIDRIQELEVKVEKLENLPKRGRPVGVKNAPNDENRA